MKFKLNKNNNTEHLQEKLSSVEEFDELTQLVRRKEWIPLTAFGSLVMLVIIWSIFGQLPVNVKGKGILVSPGRVVDFESPISGQLKQVNVKIGDCVEKDEVLATIDPSDIRQQLEQERAKLAELKRQDLAASSLELERTKLEIATIEKQQINKQQSLDHVLRLTPILKEQKIEAIKQQRMSLQQQLGDAKRINAVFKNRLDKRRFLLKEGVLSEDQILQAEQEYQQNFQKIAQLKAQLRELDVTEIETQQNYLDNLSKISQLRADLQQLEAEKKRLSQENLEAFTNRKNQIEDIKRNLAELDRQYSDNKEIKSPQKGCILELTARSGSVISSGERLGSMQFQNISNEIVGVTYFSVADGKKIRSGMKIQITPDTVTRERFGGIVAEVTKVSVFPITKQGSATIVGNSELASGLVQQVSQDGAVIEVQARLQLDPDTLSGYKWSSSTGPNLEITNGTTTNALVTIEQRHPIDFVLPILREWSGIY